MRRRFVPWGILFALFVFATLWSGEVFAYALLVGLIIDGLRALLRALRSIGAGGAAPMFPKGPPLPGGLGWIGAASGLGLALLLWLALGVLAHSAVAREIVVILAMLAPDWIGPPGWIPRLVAENAPRLVPHVFDLMEVGRAVGWVVAAVIVAAPLPTLGRAVRASLAQRGQGTRIKQVAGALVLCVGLGFLLVLPAPHDLAGACRGRSGWALCGGVVSVVFHSAVPPMLALVLAVLVPTLLAALVWPWRRRHPPPAGPSAAV